MLGKVKLALRITGDAFNDEINNLIEGCKAELNMIGVELCESDALVRRAIITYCRLNFGEPSDYDRLKKSYDEQKAQLLSAHSYREEHNNG